MLLGTLSSRCDLPLSCRMHRNAYSAGHPLTEPTMHCLSVVTTFPLALPPFGMLRLQVDREAGELVADFYTNIINEKGGHGCAAAAAVHAATVPARLPGLHPWPTAEPMLLGSPGMQAWPATPSRARSSRASRGQCVHPRAPGAAAPQRRCLSRCWSATTASSPAPTWSTQTTWAASCSAPSSRWSRGQSTCRTEGTAPANGPGCPGARAQRSLACVPQPHVASLVPARLLAI